LLRKTSKKLGKITPAEKEDFYRCWWKTLLGGERGREVLCKREETQQLGNAHSYLIKTVRPRMATGRGGKAVQREKGGYERDGK